MVAVRFAVMPIQALAISLPSIGLQHGKPLTILRVTSSPSPIRLQSPLTRVQCSQESPQPCASAALGARGALEANECALVQPPSTLHVPWLGTHAEREPWGSAPSVYVTGTPGTLVGPSREPVPPIDSCLAPGAPHTRSPVAATTGGPPPMHGKQLSESGCMSLVPISFIAPQPHRSLRCR
ncbi:unnamed protein product [Boreogadus saida]